MAQVKIFGLRENLDAVREALSRAIHASIVAALAYPPEKKFHRFIPLEPADFIYPADRSPAYTILEIVMFAGRSEATIKTLIRTLYERIEREAGIAATDLEITVIEAPRYAWGIRGKTGDEIALSYKVEV